MRAISSHVAPKLAGASAASKFAKQELCVTHTYKLDVKNKCRDERGRFADGKFCRA